MICFKKNTYNFLLIMLKSAFIIVIMFFSNVYAKDELENTNISRGRVTNLPLPRFVTLKGEKTYMRLGPGKDYGLLWIYQKKGLPVEIIEEYEQWRRVRDLDGSEGWIHQSVLSGRRMVITLEGTHNLYENPNTDSDIVAMIEGNTIISPEECNKYYCFVNHSEFSGWIEKSVLYGVYDEEIFH